MNHHEQHLKAEIAELEAKHFALLERHGFALESLRRMVEILEFMGQEKCIDVKVAKRFLEREAVGVKP